MRLPKGSFFVFLAWQVSRKSGLRNNFPCMARMRFIEWCARQTSCAYIAIHRKPHTVLRRLAVQLRTVFGDAPCLKLSVDGYIPYALLPPQHLTVKTPLRLLQIRCVLVQTTVSFQYPLLITMKKAPCRALFDVALFFL